MNKEITAIEAGAGYVNLTVSAVVLIRGEVVPNVVKVVRLSAAEADELGRTLIYYGKISEQLACCAPQSTAVPAAEQA